MMKKCFWLIGLVFTLYAVEVFAQQTDGQSTAVVHHVGEKVVIRVADVMNGLAYDYFEAERLADDPYKNRDYLLDRIQLMRGDLATIKRLNQNKKLAGKLKEMKEHIDSLEFFTKKNDKEEIRKTFGRMYVTCFQCHTTHRDHSSLD